LPVLFCGVHRHCILVGTRVAKNNQDKTFCQPFLFKLVREKLFF